MVAWFTCQEVPEKSQRKKGGKEYRILHWRTFGIESECPILHRRTFGVEVKAQDRFRAGQELGRRPFGCAQGRRADDG